MYCGPIPSSRALVQAYGYAETLLRMRLNSTLDAWRQGEAIGGSLLLYRKRLVCLQGHVAEGCLWCLSARGLASL